ncbi:SIR2 family NAD-dependent protein deacylase [Wenyingzhuangia aestuarii]|uniref:SIR2 family NAD-dependent protein deacylase n=1 Tax=Wenyingzhuangia aestuarii TaxID=1647582 RepID=UPI00143B0109|nr:SIR2 family protein [Wenyingzhuangia aestuarii]NJB83132.1 hypothetical protein [Wenyingzhuangia aestuarii]
MIDKIPQSIRPYLLEISEQLWSNHASIMIGSGFSRNADKKDSTCKDFPDWNMLGDIFYEKLYGEKPTSNNNYLNPLKLADELESTYSRTVLDTLLKKEIPDLEHSPSELHSEVLNLPWSDVFTTNYDTLLERAANKLSEYRYEVVQNKDDLILSSKPRIIKLHGSFPSIRPFIITEEDYRTYPKVFSPFVNTVQQSLLENTFCLIGFSGDDPNFLKWIGWLKDNFGESNTPKIYLIGILNLSEGQKKLLDKRNIVPVELSYVEGIEKGDYYKALKFFIEFLYSRKEDNDYLKWLDKDFSFINLKVEELNDASVILKKIKIIINNWKIERLEYPGWIITPRNLREKLQMYTSRYIFYIDKLKLIDSKYALEFLYEFNWRYNKCLIPIFGNHIDVYEKILYETKGLIYVTDDNLHKEMWFSLQLNVLRFYREEFLHDKWGTTNTYLINNKELFDENQLCFFQYESCLKMWLEHDYLGLKKAIKEFAPNISKPFWRAKKAMLYAVLGDYKESISLLQESLSYVRNRLNLSGNVKDVYFISCESYIMLLLKFVYQSYSFKSVNEKDEKLEKNNTFFNKRWNDLLKYNCDPWGEIRDFERILNPYSETEVLKEGTNIEWRFEIGKKSKKTKYGIQDNIVNHAYSFLRFSEEIAIPFKLDHCTLGIETAKIASKIISKYSPEWCFSLVLRIGEEKTINKLFDRKYLSTKSANEIDLIINNYLSIYKKIENFYEGDKLTSYKNLIIIILNRLCVKCSNITLVFVSKFLVEVLNSYEDRRLDIVSICKTFETITKISSNRNINLIFRDVLKITPVSVIQESQFNQNANVFGNFIDRKKDLILNDIKYSNYNIDDYFKSLNNKYAFDRLINYYTLEILDDADEDRLINKLFDSSNIDSFGIPKSPSHYYKFAFYNLFEEKRNNLHSSYKEFFIDFKIKINDVITRGKSITSTSFSEQELINILGINGSFWELELLENVFFKINNWWKRDKRYLNNHKEAFGRTVSEDFENRFSYLIGILKFVIRPNYKKFELETKSEIALLVKDIQDSHLNCLDLNIYYYSTFTSLKKKQVLEDLYVSLYSTDSVKVGNACRALQDMIWNKDAFVIQKRQVYKKHIDAIFSIIKTSCLNFQQYYLDVVTHIIKHNYNIINMTRKDDLMIALTRLKETEIDKKDSADIVGQKLVVLKTVSALVYELKKKYDLTNQDYDKILNYWINKFKRDEEFLDVKYLWVNN